MKKETPPGMIKCVVVFVIIALLGVAGIYLVYSSLSQDKEDLESTLSKIAASRPENLLPNKKNLDIVTQNLEAVEKIHSASFPVLVEKSSLFDAIRSTADKNKGVDKEAWKRMLNSKLDELNQMALASKVRLPGDFYYGFRTYKVTTPGEGSTFALGVQLLAIEELGKILISNKILSIEAVKRAMVEPLSSGPAGAVGASEATKENVAEGPNGLYSVYPFELDFRTSVENLHGVINGILKSNYSFVIRSIQITNEKLTLPTQGQLEASLGINSDPNAAPTTSTANPATQKNFIVVAGEESVNVKLSVDLLLWKNPADEPAKTPAKPATQSPRGGKK